MKKPVYLLTMMAEMYHAYFREYQNDVDLYADKTKYSDYVYERDNVNRYIQRQIDLNRKCFAIMYENEMAGELVIKNIEPNKFATLGICMKNENYKNKGYGTQAERLAIQYVFNELDIPLLFADSLLSNTRSQHVLEKVGFALIKTDDLFKYYQIQRENSRK